MFRMLDLRALAHLIPQPMPHIPRLLRGRERGSVLVIVAASLIPLMGMVGLSVDVGRLMSTRRQLQNAADAAALAGAQRLPDYTTQARADASTWATKNGMTNADTVTATVQTTTIDNDTMQVTVHRQVSYTFARVLGFRTQDVSATATVRVLRVVGADTWGPAIFPYGVWAGNANGLADVAPGKSVTYRSNQYRNQVKASSPSCPSSWKNNCNWNVGSNTFKGYFHWHNRYQYLDPTSRQVEDQGGNAFGTEPVAALVAFQQAGTPVWLPVLTYADDSSTDLHFTIPNFVCVKLDPLDTSGSKDWTGTVLDPSDLGCMKSIGLLTGPGTPPTQYSQLQEKMVE